MLPRRLIMDHPWLVMEGLMLRHLSADAKEAVLRVHELGQEVLRAQKEKEALQQERNTLAKSFKTAADKEPLQKRGVEIKQRLEEVEATYDKLEQEIHAHEVLIPNLPDPGVPIGRGCWDRRNILESEMSYEEYVEYKQTVLRLVQGYLREYEA